jgi:hypothetical protein
MLVFQILGESLSIMTTKTYTEGSLLYGLYAYAYNNKKEGNDE